MENNDIISHPLAPKTPKRIRNWKNLKILASLVFVLAVFAAGVMIGRGDKIHIKWLSEPAKVASTDQLNYSSVNQLYGILKTDFDGTLTQNKLIDGLKTGLVNAAGDPYTEYFSATDAKAFNNELSGSFTGIGAELGSDDAGHIVIVSPLSGYPADKAGLKPKDIISAINGQTTTGMSIDSAVNKIRGDAGTQVKLTIIRDNGQPFDVTITRAEITLPSVTSKIDGSIGYLRITQFTNDTGKLATQAADDFKTKGVKGVVLDLRGNPGGYLSEAVNVSSLWLNSGQTVVSERRGNTIISTEYANGDNPLKGLPTVVLIDGGSASASEITAGALRDDVGATLLGQQSFGKGSVQQVEQLSGGAEVKVTIARWYTPKGINIDKHGLTPDVSVANATDAQAKAGQDPQKDQAYQLLQSKF